MKKQQVPPPATQTPPEHVCKPSCHNPCLLRDDPRPAKRKERTMDYIYVAYTQTEVLELADRLARAEGNIQEAEDHKKAIDAEHKETVTALTLEIRRISRKMRERGELRNVECEWIFGDPTPDQKTMVRLDTGEVVKIWPMQANDYQDPLPSTVPAKSEPGAETLVLQPPPDGKSSAAESSAAQ